MATSITAYPCHKCGTLYEDVAGAYTCCDIEEEDGYMCDRCGRVYKRLEEVRECEAYCEKRSTETRKKPQSLTPLTKEHNNAI